MPHRGGRGGGGRHHRHHRGGHLRPYNYYYSHSPYDYYWPPSTYIVTQQPSSDDDQDRKDELLDLAKDAHRSRMQSQRNLMLIGLLAVILVGAVLLVKKD